MANHFVTVSDASQMAEEDYRNSSMRRSHERNQYSTLSASKLSEAKLGHDNVVKRNAQTIDVDDDRYESTGSLLKDVSVSRISLKQTKKNNQMYMAVENNRG